MVNLKHFFHYLYWHLGLVLVITMATFLTLPGLTKAQLVTGGGVGGRIAPGACPPFGIGDCDSLTYTPNCGAVIGIVGPEGDPQSWGVYQWDMPLVEPPQGPPYDNWASSYVTNGFPYTHAGEYMIGYAIPSLNPLCPLPMLISIGVSQNKAGFGF